MSGLLWTALIGLMVGAIGKLLTPGQDPGGSMVPLLFGLAASFVAGYLGRMVGWYREGQSAGFIVSVLGAILLLFLYRMLIGRTSQPQILGRLRRHHRLTVTGKLHLAEGSYS